MSSHFVKNIKSDGKKVVEQSYVQSLNEEPSGNEVTSSPDTLTVVLG